MQKNRPVNLNLMTIRFPVTAISSILHRISGVLLFFFIFFLIWALHKSLQSSDAFDHLKTSLGQPWAKLLCWVFLSSLFFHFIAGIRHLIMDLGFGEGKKMGRINAYLVILVAVLFMISLGISLC